jgi:hypothetical protein
MGALTDLWKSERGLLAVLLVISAGVLAGLGYMTTPEWTEFAKWIFITYTAGKTVTGAIQIAKRGPANPERSGSTLSPVSVAQSAPEEARPA